MTNIGDPVLIVEDCRHGAPATGQTGVYEGMFPRSVLVKYKGKTLEFRHDRWVSGEIKFSDGTAAVKGVPEWEEGKPKPGDDFWFVETNPRIKLSDGSLIWGDECWWGNAVDASATLEEAQEKLERHKMMLRGMASALAEAQK